MDSPPLDAVDNLVRLLEPPLEIVWFQPSESERAEFREQIDAAYQRFGTSATELAIHDDSSHQTSEAHNIEDLLDSTGRSQVVQIVDALLVEAAMLKASDVHLQPTDRGLIVRMRIDGVLEDRHILPLAIKDEVVSRVKVMAHMNVAEHRIPQDGRASVNLGEKSVDLRISSLPGSEGERIVVRVLDQSAVLLSLDHLGMPEDCLLRYKQMVTAPHGIVLVTGPTGSGKTTTLYASMMSLDRARANIITIEDPIEYRLDGISQTQTNDKVGLTFATGLRSMLRQDPDVMMIGEIRDHETAVMAIQASLTGHLVLSTLHTNDSVSSIARLIDLGLERYLVASSLLGILAQRLVRSVCPSCGRARQATAAECAVLGLDTSQEYMITEGAGCPSCRQTGYSGRRGIFELLSVEDRVRDAILRGASTTEISSIAERDGLVHLGQSARTLVLAGQTSLSEAERVTSHTAAAEEVEL